MSLKSYLTEIADAIREKKGTTDPINAQDFAKEIEALSGGVTVETPDGESKFFEGVFDGSPLTVTESGIVDISAMLDEQKLPLSINVDTDVKVIDVKTLPSDKINKVAFVVNDGVRYKEGDAYPNGTIVHIYVVETLPEVGKGDTANEVYCYFLKSNDSVIPYIWFDSAWTQYPLDVFYSESEIPEGAINYFLYLDEESNSQPINEKAIYRTPVKAPDEAYLYIGALGGRQDYFEGAKINWIIVDTLPTAGESFIDNPMAPSKATIYYQKSDNLAYIYLDAVLSDLMAGPVGWYELSMMNYDYTVITSEDQATNPEAMYIVYKEGYELPLTETAYTYFNGAKNDFNGAPVTVNIVDFLPAVGEAIADNAETPSYVIFYYQRKDKQAYGYLPEGLFEGVSGWFSASVLFTEFTGGAFNFAIVNTEAEATDSTTFYLIYQPGACRLYYYRDGWKGMGTTVTSNGSAPLIGDVTSDMLGDMQNPDTMDLSKATPHNAIYFNTALSVEEVEATFAKVTLPEGAIGIIVAMGATTDLSSAIQIMAIMSGEKVTLAITDGDSLLVIFSSSDGWNADLVAAGGVYPLQSMYFVAPGAVVGNMSIDNQQELYANVMGFSSNFDGGTGESKPLAGSFDGSSITVTQNGTVDIGSMLDEQKLPLKVSVNVPEPNGSMTITSNGTHDVKNYAEAVVNVPETLYDYENENVTIIAPYQFEKLDIIKTLNCQNLTDIGKYSFYNCKNLTEIIIPENVISIGDRAFEECNLLSNIQYNATMCVESPASVSTASFYHVGKSVHSGTSLTIGTNVKMIPSYLFSQRDPSQRYLNKIIFEEESTCESIEKGAFFGVGISNLEIPSSIKYIKDAAFQNTYYLSSIILNEGLISIGANAFSGSNYGGNASLSIPNSVTSIGDWAFYDNSSFNTLYIGAGLIEIGEQAFSKCENLSNITVSESNSVYSSANGVLYNKNMTQLIAYPPAKNITIFTIPNGVTSIGDWAFYYCSDLTSITIPDSVTSIGKDAVAYCSDLTSVVVGNGIQEIREFAFQNCKNLMTIQYTGTKAQWKAITFKNNWNYNTGNYTITCTDGTIAKDGTET